MCSEAFTSSSPLVPVWLFICTLYKEPINTSASLSSMSHPRKLQNIRSGNPSLYLDVRLQMETLDLIGQINCQNLGAVLWTFLVAQW